MSDGVASPHVPDGPVPSSHGGERLLDLIKVQARLRAEDGCPWDREQTHRSLARHLLEETYELLDAIEAGDPDAIRDELGDVLLQVTFHAQISADEGGWDVDDVAAGLVRKLIHRHPHVFGDADVRDAEEVLVNWERLKAEESAVRRAVDDDIPERLPALTRAAKVQRRAAGWGVEWPDVDASIQALREVVDELGSVADPRAAEERVGEVLFAAVAAARKLGVDAESTLRRTTAGFAARYERFVELAASRGVDADAASEEEVRAIFREARDG